MKRRLIPELSAGDWREFCSRFHFPSDALPTIRAIYTALLPLVEANAFYSLDEDLAEVDFSHYAYGFVTLGTGVDELSELYLNHEQIEEAYIVDCLSLMLLSNAYEEFSHAIEDQSGLHPVELSFLGDTYPIDLLPQIYTRLAPEGIRLTDGQIHSLCNTCASCKNYSCPSRKNSLLQDLPRTYGAMQIFRLK